MKKYRIIAFWIEEEVPIHSKSLGDVYSPEALIAKKADEWFDMWAEKIPEGLKNQAWVKYEEVDES